KVTHPGFSIAPMLNSGTSSWLYSSNGYGCPKYPAKKSRPARVTSKMLAACSSTYCTSDSRHQSPSGRLSCSPATTWYGPPTTATRYGGSGGVALKRVTVRPADESVDTTRALLHTRHDAGASTVICTGPLRSGWSKQANTLCASKGSKCVYT